jgi:hypothetical protein
VEKLRSGSKSFWDQLGFFQNENNQNDFKRVWNMLPLFPTLPTWKSRSPLIGHVSTMDNPGISFNPWTSMDDQWIYMDISGSSLDVHG